MTSAFVVSTVSANARIDRSTALNGIALAIGAAALLAIVSIAARPLLPVDETRYLTVAWEMYQSHNWLVPHLNGGAYSHKPPLLFWLINMVWSAVGPSETAARLVPAAFLPLTVWLASILGSQIGGVAVAGRAALITASTLVFAVCSTLVMFDAMLTAMVLASLIGLLVASDGRPVRGFFLVGIMIGLGVLTKGPAMLVHVLPAALLAPLWAKKPQIWFVWYAGVVLAVALGAVLALSWALPAAQAGGPAFGGMILWGQTAGRMVAAFDHARPFWFYIVLLPALLLPWSVSRNLWALVRRNAGAAHIDQGAVNRTARLPLIAAVGTFVLFSLISGKQIHYIAPAYPSLAIALALLLSRRSSLSEPGFAILTFLVGLVLILVYPLHILPVAASPFAFALGGVIVIALSPVVWSLRSAPETAGLATTMIIALGLHISAALGGFAAYDAGWVTPWLAGKPNDVPLAVAGEYAGEYGFVARLDRSVEVIPPETAAGWLTDHPGGILVYHYRGESEVKAKPRERHAYRGGMLGVWVAAPNPAEVPDHAPASH